MKDQLPIEEKMKKTGRMVVGAEQRLIKLRRTLRQSLRRANPQDFPLDEDDSSCIIQRVFRGYRVRLVISLLYVERTVVVWEAASCREYYYDKVTGRSSWRLPRTRLTFIPLTSHPHPPHASITCLIVQLLLKRHITRLAFMDDVSPPIKWMLKINCA
eukprot:gene32370-41649_t